MAIPGETHSLLRLLPDRAETTVAEQLATLDFKPLARDDRPYLALNFAATLDGRAAISGRSGPIGSEVDTEMLQRLRTRFDAVMIGAGTMRAERYGRIVSDPQLRAYRERTLLTHDPLAVIVSNRFELPWDAGLFTDGGGRVVIFTASEEEPPETATPVTVVRHPEGVELDRALEWLLTERGIQLRPLRGRSHPSRAAARGGPRRRALPDDRRRSSPAARARESSRAPCPRSRSSSSPGCSSTTASSSPATGALRATTRELPASSRGRASLATTRTARLAIARATMPD